MRRKSIGLVIALVLACVTGVLLILCHEDGGARPMVSVEEPAREEAPASRAPASRAVEEIDSTSFAQAEARWQADKPASYGSVQWELMSTVAELFGESAPKDVIGKKLDSATLKRFKTELGPFVLRKRQLDEAMSTEGSKRAKEVYDAGGWEVFPERKVTLPDPTNPGKTFTRNASPYDDQAKNELISETGAVGFLGKTENRVVRLRPDNDSVWALIVDRHETALAELRRELRKVIETFSRAK